MALSLKALLTLVVVVVLLQPWSHVYARRPSFVGGPWKNAHATFYGAGDGTGRTGTHSTFFFLYVTCTACMDCMHIVITYFSHKKRKTDSIPVKFYAEIVIMKSSHIILK